MSGCGSVIWRFGGLGWLKYFSSIAPRRMEPAAAEIITARGRRMFTFLSICFSFLFMLF